MGIMEKLVGLRRFRLARELMLVYGLDIPKEVIVGPGIQLQHRGMGTVVHPLTTFGSRVTVYHQVTIGRKDGHIPFEQSAMERIVIGDDVVLYPGSKILGGPGITSVGRGTIVAANAVLFSSTGEWEIWAGIPARRVGLRPKPGVHSAKTA